MRIGVFLALTFVIGALVGLVVAAFIVVTGNLGARLYPPGGSPWRRLLVPIAGSLATGYLLYRYFPYARGSGIPQTKAALFAREGYIQLRTVVGKFFCWSTSLASGIVLGREGPSVQVGASIASVLGRRIGLPPDKVKALIPVGASAAVAAAFNTPLAGVVFALEEIMGDMNAPVLGSVVLSSATAWIVLHLLLGDEPLFHAPTYELVHGVKLAVYAVLGLLGGLVSRAFVKLLPGLRAWFLRRPLRTSWFHPMVGGILVGIMGWFVPQSRDYAIIVPLMISNLISFFISRRLQPETIYEALSHQDGVHLLRSGARGGIGALRVFEAIIPEPPVIEPQTTIREALETMRSLAVRAWPVVTLAGVMRAYGIRST